MPSRDRIPSLINAEYDKDTEGQWGFHRSEIFKTASKYVFDSLVLTDVSTHFPDSLPKLCETLVNIPVQLRSGH